MLSSSRMSHYKVKINNALSDALKIVNYILKSRLSSLLCNIVNEGHKTLSDAGESYDENILAMK